MARKNILLIEDDEGDQQIFVTVLRSINAGFTCTVLDNAEEALNKLEAAELSTDLIFLDLGLPGMTGQEFLKELLKIHLPKLIPVFVLAGIHNEDDIRETKELGAMDFIVKPGRYSELKNTLVPILQGLFFTES